MFLSDFYPSFCLTLILLHLVDVCGYLVVVCETETAMDDERALYGREVTVVLEDRGCSDSWVSVFVVGYLMSIY